MQNAEIPEANGDIGMLEQLEAADISRITRYWERLKNKDLNLTRFTFQMLRENIARARELSNATLHDDPSSPEEGSEQEIRQLHQIVASRFDELHRAVRGPGILMIDNDLKPDQTWDDIDRIIEKRGFGWTEREKDSRRLIASEAGNEILRRYDEYVRAQEAARRPGEIMFSVEEATVQVIGS